MTRGPTLNKLIAERLSRRGFLKGAAAAGAASLVATPAGAMGLPFAAGKPLKFTEIRHSYTATHEVAPGYDARLLLRWGDVIIGEPAPFAIKDGADQGRRFGYNCDYIAFMPLPLGSKSSSHGLLCVNHESATTRMMFAGVASDDFAARTPSAKRTAIEMSAVGLSVVEVIREDGVWRMVPQSTYNRRITAATQMEITGPLAGHARLKTSADPSGTRVLGTFANCAGGFTPWGTVLSAEENIQDFFWGDLRALGSAPGNNARNFRKLGIGRMSELGAAGAPMPLPVLPTNTWYANETRFDIAREPNEANRFGYIVEIDPYDPQSVPKKRTALGRFRHECASVHAKNGKPVVVYTCDDAVNQYVYRFVSRGTYRAGDRAANMDLLAEGELYVAKFFPDGSGEWRKLAYGGQWLTPETTKFESEAEIFLETRLAGELAGATPMDRPEDVEIDPHTGRIYLALTKGVTRKGEEADAANPRWENLAGHIVEMLPPGSDGNRDHLAATFTWDILLLAGNPDHPSPAQRGFYNSGVQPSGWFSNPDNLAIDPKGRLWIATDGFKGYTTPDGAPAPVHEGLWACETTGPNRALTRHFFGCPRGAEATGPCFTPDGKTLFVSVQHPGDESGACTYADPACRWPDFDSNTPPRPSVVAITKKDGGEIGS